MKMKGRRLDVKGDAEGGGKPRRGNGGKGMGVMKQLLERGQRTSSGADAVRISGAVENQEMFERLLTYEPGFDRNFRALIRKALQKARANLSKDARDYIKNDPRKAAKAVKHTVYKEIFGGNLSILQKRRAGAPSGYTRPKKLKAGQRGGNRRPYVAERNRLDKYYGSDRGFVLRFLNSGTVERETRYGGRGSIRQTGWFGHTAPWQMENAAEMVAEKVNEYIRKQAGQ